MKNIYLLIAFFSCTATAFCQQKSGFGLSLTAGNYTLPGQHTTYGYGNTITTKHQAGISIGGGIHYNWQLSKRFSIVSTLLLRRSFFSVELNNEMRFRDGGEQYDANGTSGYEVSESIISLPVKAQYAFGSKRRTSLVLGSGISRAINISSRESFSFYYLVSPDKISAYTSSRFRNSLGDFQFEFPIVAGLLQQISDKTTLGIEYTYQKRRLKRSQYEYDDICVCCDCGYGFSQVPAIQNIAILMQYKLLK